MFDIFNRIAREDRVSRVSKYTLGTTFFQGFCCFTQCATGIDHIVNQHAVTASDVTDDVHHLRNVSAWAAFVDNRHISIV